MRSAGASCNVISVQIISVPHARACRRPSIKLVVYTCRAKLCHITICGARGALFCRHLFLMESVMDVSANLFVRPSSVYCYAKRFLATRDIRPFLKKNGPAKDLCEYEELATAR